ncbi:MAG: Fic family protein, partial [Cyanobacteria bacterium]|nr:Fic family protein [Cyanobacteriota bacterium]
MIEAPTRIEPCLFESAVPVALTDLAVEIQAESTSIGRNLNEDSLAELADLVRIMNSYYSNLIEGHNTRPRDIERALAGHEVEQDKRPLALEAKAHVDVQRAIDIAHRSGKLPVPVSTKFISWVHKCFYDEMPEEFRFTEGKDGAKIPIVPGKFRSEPSDDVAVGWHQPPSSAVIASFM